MADIVKDTQSISKAKDFRDDTKLIMQSFANWEEYLVPAPVSIDFLGQLVRMSSNVDFPINKNPPEGGFKYIKYPDSFRACLMQVANSMSAAFSEAHKNMEQILLHTGNVTAHIKVLMKVSLQDNDELTGSLLPEHEGIIAAISDACERLADKTERKCIFVLDLIQDFLEACIYSKEAYGDDQEKGFTNTPVFTPQPPKQAESGSKRAGDTAVENARFRIEQSRAQLEMIRQKQQESLANLEKNEKELSEILISLQNCNIKEIDSQTTIKMLGKGLDAMGRVKEQWEKMVRFFQMISNIIKTSLSRSQVILSDFVKKYKKAPKKFLTYELLLDMIYQQAMHSSNVASLVNMIAGTFFEVSDKHLMDIVSSLGVLMILDPSKSYLDTEHRKFTKACYEAQEAIRDLVKKNNKTFDEKTKERMERIERELKPMLPPVSEEKMKELKETTENAFSVRMSQEDEDLFA